MYSRIPNAIERSESVAFIVSNTTIKVLTVAGGCISGLQILLLLLAELQIPKSEFKK